jgi:hypothetical protein
MLAAEVAPEKLTEVVVDADEPDPESCRQPDRSAMGASTPLASKATEQTRLKSRCPKIVKVNPKQKPQVEPLDAVYLFGWTALGLEGPCGHEARLRA